MKSLFIGKLWHGVIIRGVKILRDTDNNIRTLFERANRGMSQINEWFLTNKLSLNVGKTKCMLFHKLTDQENIPLKLP